MSSATQSAQSFELAGPALQHSRLSRDVQGDCESGSRDEGKSRAGLGWIAIELTDSINHRVGGAPEGRAFTPQQALM